MAAAKAAGRRRAIHGRIHCVAVGRARVVLRGDVRRQDDQGEQGDSCEVMMASVHGDSLMEKT